MIKKIIIILSVIVVSSCATIKDKMPERTACTGNETNKTLAEFFCKK